MSSNRRPKGAISTSHYLATEAGAAALEAGGNAIDAALAAAATLCVVYPNNVALGGDLVALVRSPEGEISFLNATGTAPTGQTLDALRARYGEQLPLRGIDTVTVPGGVRGWEALHERGASLSWASHFEAAITHAAEGFPNSRSVAAELIDSEASFSQDPGAKAIFYPNGTPLREGDTLLQTTLAHTLRRIATEGAGEFYSGETAQKWVAGLGRLGSKISLEDTKSYRPKWGTPLSGEYAGLSVLTSPPNTSGFMFLRALKAIADGIKDPLGAGAGQLARAFHSANAVRAASLADPDFDGASGQELVDMPAPQLPTASERKASGDTVGLSAVSSDGWAISLINSVYWGFGAHILEPDTGVLFQNRGTSFSLDPSSPNAFAPGKRPRHTLMPALILRDNEVAWVPATMGGAAQPQIHTQLLLRYVNGASPSEATHAPRWMVQEHTASVPSVLAEEDVPEEARTAIERAGFKVEIVPRYTEDLGHSNLIEVSQTGYEAASDPRSDGSAIVVQATK